MGGNSFFDGLNTMAKRMPKPATIQSYITGKGGASSFNPVGLDFVVKGRAANAEAFGGFNFVAVGLLERPDDDVAFNALQQCEVCVQFLRRRVASVRVGDGKIGGGNFAAFAQEHRA